MSGSVEDHSKALAEEMVKDLDFMKEPVVKVTSKEFKKGWKAAKKHAGYKIEDLEHRLEKMHTAFDNAKAALTRRLEKIKSLQQELESEKNTSQVWFDRYHDVHKLTGLTPHIHAVPEYIQTLQKELETSKKLYARKCDQHMEAEQELEAVKEDLKNCFIAGYEQGHNDTVESVYGSAEDIYEDIKNELLKGGNDGMATRLSVE